MRLPVDLRSDTVTWPSEGMLRAMTTAALGDDVFDDDPTIKKLEARAAELMGKEAGLFVPSGTMGNQVAIWTHTRRGNEVICGLPCHVQEHEVGAAAVISGVTLVTVDAPTGRMDPAEIEAVIRGEDVHFPETGLLCLECAHGSGAVQSFEELQAMRAVAVKHGLPVHLDGARIFNAALALNVPAADIATLGESVMFCLSKGLGAPIGSMLCGTSAFVARSRKGRKLLGGGMRQVGLLGGAGLYALEHNLDRLEEDHRRAERLAAALKEIPGVRVFDDRRDINMVWFTLDHPKPEDHIVSELAKRNVRILPSLGQGQWRMVTHLDIDDEALDHAIEQIRAVIN